MGLRLEKCSKNFFFINTLDPPESESEPEPGAGAGAGSRAGAAEIKTILVMR